MKIKFLIIFLSVFQLVRAFNSNDNGELLQDVIELAEESENDNYISINNVAEIILSRLLENLSSNKETLNQYDTNGIIEPDQMESDDRVENLLKTYYKSMKSKPNSLILYAPHLRKQNLQ
jgi:hypothetical protein